MSKSLRILKVHVDYKSGGEYDFPDAVKVEINIARMLFIDYIDGSRHTEDFAKVERIIIQSSNKDLLKDSVILETHGSVMIVKKKETEKTKQLCVWDWLGITEEDFRKKSGKGVCVVSGCGKPTKLSDNLCIGHKIAYRRWRNKETPSE